MFGLILLFLSDPISPTQFDPLAIGEKHNQQRSHTRHTTTTKPPVSLYALTTSIWIETAKATTSCPPPLDQATPVCRRHVYIAKNIQEFNDTKQSD
ncbi:hypothetical protein DFA_01120 [Cavenderia fasciculata]|uniref:Uncharacterized protein n=1 Tax=Cavenderia fasciculata TaxID=261658 RepID=F4PQX8_CACFS|nr:uncharacterized protein DFA_01120 [Cavenderia fasciculata]EGG21243.1 hypothetical protein DFA_01120 [Cavenderia fasciculata]|eukprot:XP_004359093.1 hypothetical protein DFA_01120 [Cavenderia fasciculata]